MIRLSHACVLSALSSLAHGARPSVLDGHLNLSEWYWGPCSVSNGTGPSSDYPCRCGSATCSRRRDWCTAAAAFNECSEPEASALRAAFYKSGDKAIPLIINFFNDMETNGMEGTWRYDKNQYQLQAIPEGSFRVNENFRSGLKVSGLLRPLGKWYQGEVLEVVRGSKIGTFRVRFDEARDEVVSQFKSIKMDEWIQETVAHRLDYTLRKAVIEVLLPEFIKALGTQTEPLVDRVLNDSSLWVRRQACLHVLPVAIGKLGTRAETFVEKALSDKSSEVRRAAAKLASNATATFGVGMIRLIREGLNDSDPTVRRLFADQLDTTVTMLGKASLSLLGMALQSADEEVRSRAAGQPLLTVARNNTLSKSFDAANWTRRMVNDSATSVRLAAGGAASVLAMALLYDAEDEKAKAIEAKAKALNETKAAQAMAAKAIEAEGKALKETRAAQAMANETKREWESASIARKKAEEAAINAKLGKKIAEKREDAALESLKRSAVEAARAEAKLKVFEDGEKERDQLEKDLKDQRTKLEDTTLHAKIVEAEVAKEKEMDDKAKEEKKAQEQKLQEEKEQAQQWKLFFFGAILSVATALVPVAWKGVQFYMAKGAEERGPAERGND